ncbi:hypothetical protein PspLS_07857 [Pyricularia sp. CBS 133598]|nr:hypothetical protein PspLS_07857 [Pyricularia sp. CBS 133598]
MATIEPRLMHLLNDSKSNHDLNELPPLQSFPIPKGSAVHVSLPSLSLEIDQRDEQFAVKLPAGPPLHHIPPFSTLNSLDDNASAQHIPPLSLVESSEDTPSSQQIPPFSTFESLDDAPHRSGPPTRLPNPTYVFDGPARIPQTANQSIRSLLGDSSPVESSSHSLRKILDDLPPELGIHDDATTKKRHRALAGKEDFVQLPQPLKKQKSAQQVMPPIINGLHEPPPNAAVFPPISSVEFRNGDHSLSLRPIKDLGHIPEDRHAPVTPTEDKTAQPTVKTRRRTKPRRKWTEEETNHLLIGVSRHGVGKWTSILEDPDFQFNDRTAGDLKDRFRTCCPDELRGQINAGGGAGKGRASQATTTSPNYSTDTQARTKRTLMLENILIGNDSQPEHDASNISPANATAASTSTSPVSSSSQPQPKASADASQKPRKSRAHRKKLEDLAELGISGPFKKSHRRERRPFTEQDDKEILEGIHRYGPAWTKIQRDEAFNLSSRQPTDLRDRVRNKYPDIYAKIEKGAFQIIKEPNNSHRNNLMEPTVNTTIENSLTSVNKPGGSSLEAQLNRTGSKENLPKWSLQHYAHDIKKHQKRLAAPSHWLLDKLSGVYAPKPSPGPHKQRECLPLIVFIRNRLKYALNGRETKAILMQRLVKVDGKVRTDSTYPAGFMDVVSIEKTGENFRLVYDTKGRFTVHRIQAEEAEYKLGKVKRVQLGRGGIPFLVTHDARTIRYPDPLIKVNDTVKINLDTGKITDFIKFDTGALAMVTAGNNMGRVGVITHRERHDGGFNIVHLKDAIDNTFTTRESNVFVIGTEKPWISLPKGKGVKLTIAEERDRRRAQTIAGH